MRSDTGGSADDLHELNRFVEAQEHVYERALAEIRSGQKMSHWMWFIFPQFEGLGMSSTAVRYAIRSVDEATAYLAHPVLGARLIECARAVLDVNGRSANQIFGSPDDMKLRSSATLFARISRPDSIFERILEKYFGGTPDTRTLALIDAA